MYEQFFGLKEQPFNLTPDPQFMYLSHKHTEALSSLHYGVSWRKGFLVITGEIGAGKTTLCRTFLDQIKNKAKTALILNPKVSELQLLQTIVEDFGIETKAKNKKALFDALNSFLLDIGHQGGIAVLIIDEAQNLSLHALEQIRLISNVETEKQKLIQIVLVGQPEFREFLNQSSLVQLRQRIAVRYHLTSLSFTETEEYIYHRLEVAGAAKESVSFSAQALHAIYQYSKGIPRLINLICDKTLLAAYAREVREVSYALVHEAIREVEGVLPSRDSIQSFSEERVVQS
jgi:general secretion pathway protein A